MMEAEMNRHMEVPVEFKIPKTYSVAMTSGAATSFATALMESFSFLGDKETIMTNQDFLSGSFVANLNRESSEEDKKKYYQQVSPRHLPSVSSFLWS